jgi:tetratricopeptide (TPR) repeat protein
MECAPRAARRQVVSLLALAAIALAVTARPAPAQTRGLTAAPALARAYDEILDGRFETAAADLKQACGPAPPVACTMLEAVSVWWQIQMDPDSRALDAAFQSKVNAGIQAADAWTAREPKRAEAWFYLGAGYGARAQWRVLRNEKLSAARDGKRIKDSLEHALALDPGLEDAHFGIGLYKYIAGVAPTVLKVLRWLLFLPGGNRAEGLAEMLQARERGQLLRGEADYQLHLMYLWYEQQPARALALLAGLEQRYPGNPLFSLQTAEVQDVYLHDHTASLATFRRVVDAAHDHRVVMADLAEARARLGAARELDALAETDLAIEDLKAVIAARPAAPYGALAQAQLALGQAYDRLGQRSLAVAAYEAARLAAPPDDPGSVRAHASEGLQRKPDPRVTEAYRLSLEGERATERGALADAEAALSRAATLSPNDPVIQFRRGKLFEARDDRSHALGQFERVIAARPQAIPTILAAAYLEAGRLLERSNQRARAIEMYRGAARTNGADAGTRDAALRSLARLGVSMTPQ